MNSTHVEQSVLEESTLVQNSWTCGENEETRKVGRPKGQLQTELNGNGSAQIGSPTKYCPTELEKADSNFT